jgi:hypothetical protein
MEILVLDIECGNIDPRIAFRVDNDVICELGIVKLDLETGTTEVLLDETCKETNNCHPDSWIFHNSSLTHVEVQNSTDLSLMSCTIQEFFNQYPVTSWNQNYDFPRLEHQSRGLTIHKKYWDPMIELTDYLKLPKTSGIGNKWPKLAEAYEFMFGDPSPRSHRALEDALDAADVIYQAIKRWPNLLELDSLSI